LRIVTLHRAEDTEDAQTTINTEIAKIAERFDGRREAAVEVKRIGIRAPVAVCGSYSDSLGLNPGLAARASPPVEYSAFSARPPWTLR